MKCERQTCREHAEELAVWKARYEHQKDIITSLEASIARLRVLARGEALDEFDATQAALLERDLYMARIERLRDAIQKLARNLDGHESDALSARLYD